MQNAETVLLFIFGSLLSTIAIAETKSDVTKPLVDHLMEMTNDVPVNNAKELASFFIVYEGMLDSINNATKSASDAYHFNPIVRKENLDFIKASTYRDHAQLVAGITHAHDEINSIIKERDMVVAYNAASRVLQRSVNKHAWAATKSKIYDAIVALEGDSREIGAEAWASSYRETLDFFVEQNLGSFFLPAFNAAMDALKSDSDFCLSLNETIDLIKNSWLTFLSEPLRVVMQERISALVENPSLF